MRWPMSNHQCAGASHHICTSRLEAARKRVAHITYLWQQLRAGTATSTASTFLLLSPGQEKEVDAFVVKLFLGDKQASE